MQNDKLLPCPFCGGELKLNTILTIFICNKCKVHIGFPTCYTDESRIKAVNTRKPMERIVEQIEENGQKMSEAKAIRPYAKYSPADHRYYKAISVKKAIEIVRSGGKE